MFAGSQPLLSGGRPGLWLWVGNRDATEWTPISVPVREKLIALLFSHGISLILAVLRLTVRGMGACTRT